MSDRKNHFSRFLLVVSLLLFVTVAGGCASSGGGGEKSSKIVPPPAGSTLAKVEKGMTDFQVRKIMGEPDNANAYQTGKAWIPFYFGGDTHRTDWIYSGTGRVVFSRNQWTGGLSVVHVHYDPDQS